MFIKNFSVKLVSGNPLKDDSVKIYVQVIYDRKIFRIPTPIKVPETSFDSEKIIKHVHAKEYNAILIKQKGNIEKIINDAIFNDQPISLELLTGHSATKDLFVTFIDKVIKVNTGKLSEGRIKHYKSMKKKIEDYNQKLKFSDIDQSFLPNFEQFIRKPDKDGNAITGNTVNTNIKIIKAFLNMAIDQGLLSSEILRGYKNPKYVQKIPIYLTEDEINSFSNIVITTGNDAYRMCGYYFLLSCYTGYRISDLMSFDYEASVSGNKLTIRAKKNKSIVSIPIYAKLKEVLKYCKTNKLDISEQHFRKYVKFIAKFAGIKKEITPHVGRHSFAMLMIAKGLSVDEVAILLGDSRDVAAIYARITNTHLSDRINKIMD